MYYSTVGFTSQLVIAVFKFWDRSQSTILILNTKHCNKSAGMKTCNKKKAGIQPTPKMFWLSNILVCKYYWCVGSATAAYV